MGLGRVRTIFAAAGHTEAFPGIWSGHADTYWRQVVVPNDPFLSDSYIAALGEVDHDLAEMARRQMERAAVAALSFPLRRIAPCMPCIYPAWLCGRGPQKRVGRPCLIEFPGLSGRLSASSWPAGPERTCRPLSAVLWSLSAECPGPARHESFGRPHVPFYRSSSAGLAGMQV